MWDKCSIRYRFLHWSTGSKEQAEHGFPSRCQAGSGQLGWYQDQAGGVVAMIQLM